MVGAFSTNKSAKSGLSIIFGRSFGVALICLIFTMHTLPGKAAMLNAAANNNIVNSFTIKAIPVAVKSRGEARRLLSKVKKLRRKLKSETRKLKSAIGKAKRVNAKLR